MYLKDFVGATLIGESVKSVVNWREEMVEENIHIGFILLGFLYFFTFNFEAEKLLGFLYSTFNFEVRENAGYLTFNFQMKKLLRFLHFAFNF